MSFIYWNVDNKPSFENYTLILPSISVGNVGQLAVDLLINNMNVTNVADIHHPSFLPIAGADPFDLNTTKLTTSCQLYECQEKKLAIIQHRAPLIGRKIPEYRNFLLSFIKEQKIVKTILLSSSFSQFFTIDALQGVPMHYLCTEGLDKSPFESLSWKQFSLPPGTDESEMSRIPGAGIARKLLEDCQKEGVPLIVLILVCSEGNNYPEAFEMVKCLNTWLCLKEGTNQDKLWKMPISWTLPYGSSAPQTLY